MRGIGGIMKRKQVYEVAPRWKVLRQWALAVPLITAVIVVLVFVSDGYRIDKREDIVRKAVSAGYKQILDGRFTRIGITSVEGVEYEEYAPAQYAAARNSKYADKSVLIPKGANYIDGADGERKYVEIYGKEVRRTDERHVIVEPFAMVKPSTSGFWDGLATFVLLLTLAPVVAIVEIVLVVKCFNAHDEWKEQERAGQV